jgi:transcriptional regulator with XRE-family HTH domain
MTISAAMELQKITGKKLTLGTCLWSIRVSDDKSQIAFAKELGISSQYLCDIERGRKTVSAKKAKEFALKLGHLPEQFVELTIQDMLDQDDLKMKVNLKAAA